MSIQFTADLSPKSAAKTDLADLVKTSEYLSKNPKSNPTTNTPGANAVLAKPLVADSWMGSGKDLPFTFGAGNTKD